MIATNGVCDTEYQAKLFDIPAPCTSPDDENAITYVPKK